MKIKYDSFSDEYKVTDGTLGRVTLTNLRTSAVFPDFYTRHDLYRRVAQGGITVTEEDASNIELKVGVDTTELASALALAKELEATMLRIRGLFK